MERTRTYLEEYDDRCQEWYRTAFQEAYAGRYNELLRQGESVQTAEVGARDGAEKAARDKLADARVHFRKSMFGF
jgi:hypothetical protein